MKPGASSLGLSGALRRKKVFVIANVDGQLNRMKNP